VANTLSIGFNARVVSVFGRKIEGEQSFSLLRQAGNCLIVLCAVFVSEYVDCCLGRRTGLRARKALPFEQDCARGCATLTRPRTSKAEQAPEINAHWACHRHPRPSVSAKKQNKTRGGNKPVRALIC